MRERWRLNGWLLMREWQIPAFAKMTALAIYLCE